MIEHQLRPVSQASQWFERISAAEVSAEDMAAFERWLQADPAHMEAYTHRAMAWTITGQPIANAGIDGAATVSKPRWNLRRVAGIAAVLLLSVMVWPLFFPSTETFTTEVGEQRAIALDDGSTAYLNTNSTMKVSYSGSVRRVTLTSGEAFFDVAKDRNRHFEVLTDMGVVRVLGTRFNVKDGGNQVTVVVTEGRVQVLQDMVNPVLEQNRASPVTLTAGEQIAFGASGLVSNIQKVDTSRGMPWRRGVHDFYNTSLAAAVSEVNRYSKVKLIIGNDTLSTLKINGIFRIGDVETIARGFEEVLPLHAVRNDNAIVLLSVREP